jgi:Tfp pilus assembly protein PilO
MKASTKRAASLLLTAVLFIASLFAYATLVRPEYNTVTLLRGELVSKTEFLTKQQAAIDGVQKLLAQYQGVARLSDSLSMALPSKENVSSILSQITAIAQSSGVAVQSVGITYLPLKPANASISLARGIGTLRLNIEMAGSYASLKRFLQSLETNIRVMDIQNLTINPVGRSDQDIFGYSLNVDTYYQP